MKTAAITIVMALALFAVNASAHGVDKSNSLAVDKDAITGIWTATCDISIKGVDGRQIYTDGCFSSSSHQAPAAPQPFLTPCFK
jgi:hypothetical protein